MVSYADINYLPGTNRCRLMLSVRNKNKAYRHILALKCACEKKTYKVFGNNATFDLK